MSNEKYRLVTRSDFDGLVCAAIFKELDMIDDIKFVHPKDMQDGKIDINNRDITTNLPYVPGVYLCFDHHLSETLRTKGVADNHIIDPEAPSAARVVYDYYGGEKAVPNIRKDMMLAVDKADSAQFSIDEILNPSGWIMLNFLMDARTGLGRFRNFRISNYNLMMDLIDYCRNHTIEEILELPDVKERAELYEKHNPDFKQMLISNATVKDNLVIIDLRNQDTIYAGNRFMKYALFPQCNVSLQIMWGRKKQNTVFTVGKSIVDRSSDLNIGKLMLEYGGGGHRNAGTCQVDNDKAEKNLLELSAKIRIEG
ncbi:MAG: exopolyphosphatase [bacterium]